MPPATAGYAPTLEKYLKSLKGQNLELSIENLISLLKRRQIIGAEPCAIATAHILLQVVARSKWHDVDTLIFNVTRTGRRLIHARPNELVIGNIVRRVLGLIRDEAAEERNELPSETPSEGQMSPIDAPSNLAQAWPSSTVSKQDSAGGYLDGGARPAPPRHAPTASYSTINVAKGLLHLLSDATSAGHVPSPLGTSGASTPLQRAGGSSSHVNALRSEVIDGIEEIKDEISQVDDQIAALAEVQVHPGDYILVHQPSPTVERFILRAAIRRRFTVLISTGPPRKWHPEDAHASFRKKLTAAGVTVINISCGGVMAYMSRVDKVILGASAIVAGGGVVSDAGAGTIARAAKEQGNPVIVLAGIYKLSPENPFGENAIIEWGDPATSVSYADGPLVKGVKVKTALTELVPGTFIDTYITNLGTHSREHLSGIIADHYQPEDLDFHLLKI